jgi:hypothetical protein
MNAADFHARQHASATGDMDFSQRRANDRSWFAAVCERGAELVQQSMAARATTPPMTTTGFGAAFDDVKAAKHAKAKATLDRVLQRSRGVDERTVSVPCPRHGRDFVVECAISIGRDGWSLDAVPTGCDGDNHTFTSDERALLADRIDDALEAP